MSAIFLIYKFPIIKLLTQVTSKKKKVKNEEILYAFLVKFR